MIWEYLASLAARRETGRECEVACGHVAAMTS